MSTTRISRHVNAPRETVYRALLDAHAVEQWMVPTGMTSHVHAFDAREGGSFRISLTYDAPTGTGKTTAHTDTYHGRFVKLVPNEQVVEVVEFETADPALRGEMTITITLAEADGGTELSRRARGLPPGVAPADNETGWQSSLAKLAALVEPGSADAVPDPRGNIAGDSPGEGQAGRAHAPQFGRDRGRRRLAAAQQALAVEDPHAEPDERDVDQQEEQRDELEGVGGKQEEHYRLRHQHQDDRQGDQTVELIG